MRTNLLLLVGLLLSIGLSIAVALSFAHSGDVDQPEGRQDQPR